MRATILVAMLALSLAAAACAQPAATPPSAASSGAGAAAPAAAQPSSGGSAAVAQAPAQPAGVAMNVSWERPANVAPLPADGKFDVISDTPWPGDKVRVFFFGVQG